MKKWVLQSEFLEAMFDITRIDTIRNIIYGKINKIPDSVITDESNTESFVYGKFNGFYQIEGNSGAIIFKDITQLEIGMKSFDVTQHNELLVKNKEDHKKKVRKTAKRISVGLGLLLLLFVLLIIILLMGTGYLTFHF